MLSDLRERVAELQALEARLKACLAAVQTVGLQAVSELEQASRDELKTTPLARIVGPPQGFVHRHISLEAVRDAVVSLRNFTIGELAAELGCSTARARNELGRVKALVKPDGRLGSRQLWAYVPPDGPGEAFQAQKRLQTHQLDETPVERIASGDVSQSLLSSVTPKELREVAREAIRDGWVLVNSGGKHPMRLEKNGRIVGLASTPTNAVHAAQAARRQLKRAS